MSIYDKFARDWDDGRKGFGRHSYNDAISAGYTPAQIAAAVEGAGKRVGVRGQELIDAYKAAADTAREKAERPAIQAAMTPRKMTIETKSMITKTESEIIKRTYPTTTIRLKTFVAKFLITNYE